MEQSLNKIITAILSGDDYRPFVFASLTNDFVLWLETINRRFIDNVHAILVKVFEARTRNASPDWWKNELVTLLRTKDEALWFSGLNKKTVRSMSGGDRKEVCVQLGKQNLEDVQRLIEELSTADVPHLEIIIHYRGQQVRLSEGEAVLLMNAIATMKLAVQGGAWSEMGKKVEKRLLFTIFEMLRIPPNQYVLVFSDMVKGGLVGNREIDAIVFTDDRRRKLQIELKLLGGNPEISDEAFARGVDLFLVDKTSAMMIEEGKKQGVTTIELRDKDTLIKIYEFFQKAGVTVQKPTLTNIALQVTDIGQRYDEEREGVAILQKVKEILA